MLTYEFAPDDLADIRFAISPMAETTLSLRALRDPSRFPLQLPWIRAAQPHLRELDWDVLGCLINDTMGSPDFLTPRPTSPLTDVESEIALIADVDQETFRSQIEAVHGHLPDLLAGADGVDRVVRETRRYWERLIAPYWQRMRAVMSADITYRGRILTERGSAAMLNDLSPYVTYEAMELRIEGVSNPSRSERIDGRGLTLIPSMFGPHVAIPFDVGAPPFASYAPRGQGTMWSTADAASDRDLARLLGRPRAALLHALDQPRSTSQLAILLGVSPSAVSQHLHVMRRTGLVAGERAGRSVLYRRSDLAQSLMGLTSGEA